MRAITYASSTRTLMTGEELMRLLTEARENNLKNDITGLLIHKDGNFMQTLEGPDGAVKELYRKICADNRHRDVITLLNENIGERSFSSWSMAFQNLDKISAQEVPGYSEFLDKPLTSDIFRDNPSAAQRLLIIFRQTCR